MRPKLLKISGINSFVEEEVIDFAKLTEKGLFGIFGPTGSGKSTILDAVTIALYNKVPRDTKEFINKETEELYVCFDFELGNNSKYSIERKMRISDTGGYKTTLARLTAAENGKKQIYDKVNEIDGKIEDVIGLNHDDFMRTVVLPQGQFSKFLKLTGRERRDMLERILGLEQFGQVLMKKLKLHRYKRKNEIEKINAVLNKYEGISEEKLEEEKKRLKELLNEQEIINTKIKEIEKKYDKYKKINNLQKSLSEYTDKLNKLKQKKERFKDLKTKAEKIKKVVSIENDLNRYNKYSKQIKETKGKVVDLKNETDELKKKKSIVKDEYQQLLEKQENQIPRLTEKKIELKNVLELADDNKALLNKRKEKKQIVDNLTNINKNNKEQLNNLQKEIDSQVDEIKEKEHKTKTLQVDSDYRNIINKGLQLENDYKNIKKFKKTAAKDLKQYQNQLKQEEDKLEKNKNKLNKVEAEIIYKYNQKINDMKSRNQELKINFNKVEEKINDLKKELKEKEEEFFQQKQKNMAGLLASGLNKAEPCPVCGSLEHPDLAETVNINQEKWSVEKQKSAKELEEYNQRRNKLRTKLELVKNKTEQLENDKKRYQRPGQYQQKYKMNSLFDNNNNINPESIESDMTLDDLKDWRDDIVNIINTVKGSLKNTRTNVDKAENNFNELNQKYSSLQQRYQKQLNRYNISSFAQEIQQIEQKDNRLEKIQKRLNIVRTNYEQNTNYLNKLKTDINQKEKQLTEKRKDLQILENEIENNNIKIKKAAGDSNPSVYLQKINKKMNNIKNNAKKKQEDLDKIQTVLNNKQNDLSTFKDRLQNLKQEAEELENFLSNKIEQFELESLDSAYKYLNWKDNLEIWQEEVEKYKKNYNTLTDNIRRIEDELDGTAITQKQWENMKQEKNMISERQQQLGEVIGGQKKTIEHLKKDLEDKNKKSKEKEKIDYQLSLIKEINDLVRGKSFVEFVAKRKLGYIAREASKRLMEITNNRYRLELNDTGEFVICDIYNGGVKRDCNTLSGGETFLSSLSLALALSTQIQLKGESNMEFFFLDEGFGTLDNNLLDIVMNSLEQLQSEELSVGIISHVEELKNRVPIKLMVKPAEPGVHGSQVKIKST